MARFKGPESVLAAHQASKAGTQGRGGCRSARRRAPPPLRCRPRRVPPLAAVGVGQAAKPLPPT